MQTTLPIVHEVETVDPSQTNISVREFPTAVSDTTLAMLHEVAKPADRVSDCLRVWLRGCVDAEIARRAAEEGELEEPAAWLVPWHTWNDEQLSHSLAASYSWLEMGLDDGTMNVLREVHRAVLTAACTRLQELHTAIENSRRNRSQQ